MIHSCHWKHRKQEEQGQAWTLQVGGCASLFMTLSGLVATFLQPVLQGDEHGGHQGDGAIDTQDDDFDMSNSQPPSDCEE